MQESLFKSTPSLFEQVCEIENLRKGFKAVKRNKGSQGIDNVSLADFEGNLDQELRQLKKELEGWSYKPQAVRRVEIPKPGKNAGVRLLGVPCIRDRVVQTSIKQLLEPVLDPMFSNNSYGFRPGRNQEQAVIAACDIVKTGKEYIVDIDLSKFFDRVSHDRLITRLSRVVEDKRILKLIGMTLRSGVMVEGVKEPTDEGTVQGSPLSPLLSNFVLDELDKELERRGLEFCRFADDANIFVRSQRAGDRVLLSISRFIEKRLKLKVNWDKTKVALSKYVKFLGMTIVNGSIAISKKSLDTAMAKVKLLTPRGTHLPIEKSLSEINRWYVGWANYYKMTNYPAQLAKIEAHIRRRLRSRFIGQHKRRRFLVKKLVSMGVRKKLAARTVHSNKGRWALSHTAALERAYTNSWFQTQGFKVFSDKQLDHWFGEKKWIRLT
ncbi:MAG: group II intron reverse transcriptase/maturase [Desulfobulbaceae bacterium]|nr:group II intron reverse transcriptase/maturase [Desulfobulbaceae bacterium]